MYPVDGLPNVLPDHLVSDGHISVLDTIKQGGATITAYPVCGEREREREKARGREREKEREREREREYETATMHIKLHT